MLSLDTEELIALQVLLVQKIEQTPATKRIFNKYIEKNLYERIMLKLCPAKNISNEQIEERLTKLPIS